MSDKITSEGRREVLLRAVGDLGKLDRRGSRVIFPSVDIPGEICGVQFTRSMPLGSFTIPKDILPLPATEEGINRAWRVIAMSLSDAILAAAERLEGATLKLEREVSELSTDLRARVAKRVAKKLSVARDSLDEDVEALRKELPSLIIVLQGRELRRHAAGVQLRRKGDRIVAVYSQTIDLSIAGDRYPVRLRVVLDNPQITDFVRTESATRIAAVLREQAEEALTLQKRAWLDQAQEMERKIHARSEDPRYNIAGLRSAVRNVLSTKQPNVSDVSIAFDTALRRLDREAAEVEALIEIGSRVDLVSYKSLFPLARSIQRKLVFYAGPTNSGKTHRALDHLVASGSGLYLAPLRLLALEGQERIEERGHPASYVTGEERDIRPGAAFTASTIEMVDLQNEVGAAVIDEVQLLSDPDRGWAWTQALVGVPARTVIMTGSPDAIPLVEKFAEYLGEPLEIHRLGRKAGLDPLPHPASYRRIEPGTAIIAFSRRDVLTLKSSLERAGRTVAVIYGNLTPAVRREEARRFRSGEAEVLVATNAIALGLNLPIRTVLFYSTMRFDGRARTHLTAREILQIAGRAGRYGIQDSGRAGAFEPEDHARIASVLTDPSGPEDLPILASVQPHPAHVRAIAEALETVKLSTILRFYGRRMTFDEPFLVASVSDAVVELAHLTDARPSVPLLDRLKFALAPIDPRYDYIASEYREWFFRFAKGRPVPAPERAEKLCRSPYAKSDYELRDAEEECRLLTAYCWLSERFPSQFTEADVARERITRLNRFVEKSLARFAVHA